MTFFYVSRAFITDIEDINGSLVLMLNFSIYEYINGYTGMSTNILILVCNVNEK